MSLGFYSFPFWTNRHSPGKSFPPWPHHHILPSTEFRSRATNNVINASTSACTVEAGGEKRYWNNCLLKINISNHFIGKRWKKLVFDSLFVHRFSPQPQTNLDQPLAQFSPPSPWVILYHILFHDARFLIKVDLYFRNEMPDYFARARGAYKSLACQKLRCFCRGRILGLLAGYWAT